MCIRDRPWAPVVFHGERDTTESLPEIDARFTPDGDGTADGPSRVKILGVVSADCH